MKLILTFIQWFFTAVAVMLFLVSLGDGHIQVLVAIALAFLIVFPLIQPLLESKLPFLRPKLLKIALFFVFVVAAALMDPGVKSMTQLKVCAKPEQSVCVEDKTLYVKDAKPIYLTATPKNIPDGTPIHVEVKYAAEPGKENTVANANIPLKISSEHAQFELPLKTMPVGAYTAVLSSDESEFLAAQRTFTVWASQQEVDNRTNGKLVSSITSLTSLKLCEEGKEDEACDGDRTTFPAGATTIAAQVEIQNAEDGVGLKFTWRYLGGPEGKAQQLSQKVQKLRDDIGTFSYSLSIEDGFPKGKYELTVALETSNAQPVRREFTVE